VEIGEGGRAILAYAFMPSPHAQSFVWSETFSPAVSIACGQGMVEIAPHPLELSQMRASVMRGGATWAARLSMELRI